MSTEAAQADRVDRPPIDYRPVRSAFNTIRAFGALVIAVLGAVGVATGHTASPYVIGASLIVIADALLGRGSGDSALRHIAIDIAVVAAMSMIRGHSTAVEAAALAYILTASLLLLPLRTAISAVVAAVALIAPVGHWTPSFDLAAQDTATERAEGLAVLVFLGLVAQLLYITARALRRAVAQHEEALRTERRASELKNEFVSMVSHELRTPLTSIAGFTETLRDSWHHIPDDEIEEFLLIMRKEAAHLGDLVEDILVIPRLEAGQLRLEPRELELNREANQAGEIIFRGTDKDFSVDIPVGVTVYADQVRTKQVLRNLMENARKYGGDQILVDGEPLGELYKVMVTDNGPGVPEADRERIFDHFEQVGKGDDRSDQGFGLGLPIARKLARAMGGDVWYEARFPIGSRFCFTLRLAAHEPRVAEETATESGIIG